MRGGFCAGLAGMFLFACFFSRAMPYLHPLALLLILGAGAFVFWALFGGADGPSARSKRLHREHYREWQTKEDQEKGG